MADDSIINYSDLIGDDGTFEELSKQIKQIESELLDMAKTTKKAFQSLKPSDLEGLDKLEKKVKEIEVAEKNLVKTKKLANKARKKTIDLTNEELIQREKEKIQQRERVQIAKQTAILRSKEAGQIEKLRAKLSLTTLEWKKLSKEELNNTKKGKDLINTKRKLTDQLKKLEKQTGDTRRNVGNYSDSLGKLGKIAARVFIGRTIIDGLRKIGGAFGQLIEDNKDANSTMKGLSDSLGGVTEAVSGAALKLLNFLAPAITAVADGISAIINFFSGAIRSVKKFSATSDELAGKIENLNSEFAKESAELQIVFSSLKKTNKGTKERRQLIDKVNEAYGKYLPKLLTEKSSLEEITKAQKIANQALTQSFLLKIKQTTLEDIVTEKVKDQIKNFEDLKNRAKSSGKEIQGNVTQFNQLVEGIKDRFSDIGKAFVSLKAGAFSFNRLNEEVRKTNPELATFLESIKGLDKNTKRVLIDNILSASKRASGYNAAIDETNKTLSDLSSSLTIYDRTVTTNTSNLDENTKAQKDNSDARIKAIEEVQKKIENLEVKNIKDKQDRLLALEELRFKEEQKQREKDFLELKALTKAQGLEIVEDERLNNKLSEEQLKIHEQNKLNIRKEFFKELSTTDITPIDVQKEQQKEEIKLLDESVKKVDEANKKKKKSNKELLNNISQTAKKVSAEINNIFQKQVDLSAKSVDEQEANLSRARDRAAKGLETNLAFEEQELAKRQSENLKRQKEAKQAAKFLTLLNLVSSYAANNDKNALARGLVDFSILTALEASFGGLYEGTEDTGTVANPLDARGGRLYTLHDNERVVPKFLNDQLNGMSNKDMVYNALLGSQIGDYYNPQSPITQDYYKAQKEAFKRDIKATQAGNSEVVNAIKNLENKIVKQPNYTAQIVKVQEDTHAFILREVKQGMTKVYKKMLRAKK
jgi:hypothetical protein